jgi:hypothetical protein
MFRDIKFCFFWYCVDVYLYKQEKVVIECVKTECLMVFKTSHKMQRGVLWQAQNDSAR